MGIVHYYARLEPSRLAAVIADSDGFFAEPPLPGIEVLYLDEAHEGLGWLLSPLKREEMEHMHRLLTDEKWASKEARGSAARLAAKSVDDEMAAISGDPACVVEAPDLGLAVVYFEPERVVELSDVLSRVTEDRLRQGLDFAAMDRVDVVPFGWLEEGEDHLRLYLMPALERLQALYAAAGKAGQGILIVVT